MSATAILLAAGAGVRLENAESKALVALGGRPLMAHALEAIVESGVIDAVVVVAPPSDLERGWEVVRTVAGGHVHVVVAGGATRQTSVRLGLAAVPVGTEVVVCHDAARPFATPNLFRRVVEAVRRAEGAVPIVPSPDTVKRVREGRVVETIPREEVGLAQTPQAFQAEALRASHARAEASGLQATDDATLLEALGFTVVTVEGEAMNLKITTPHDLAVAEGILAVRTRGTAG